MRNCPFYGCAFFKPPTGARQPFVLLYSEGNQCALILDEHAPCLMEIEEKRPEWSDCPRMAELRLP